MKNVEYGSKQHTQAAYKMFKEECNNDTKSIIEFLKWLKKENKLEHLKEMDDLNILERKLIDSI